MAIRMTNDCNGCAECIHCGRDELRKSVFCDICKREIDEKVYTFDGEQICAECLLDRVHSSWAEDLLDDGGDV